jgi:hypothetical protein
VNLTTWWSTQGLWIHECFQEVSTTSNFNNGDSRIGTFEVFRSSPSPKVSMRQLTKSNEGCHAPLRGNFGPLEVFFWPWKHGQIQHKDWKHY